MTQSITFRSLIAASAAAGAAAITMFGQTATAEAKSVLECRGSDRSALIRCCTDQVKHEGLPNWMRSSGQNCQSAVMMCKSKTGGNWIAVAAVAPGAAVRCKYVVSTQPRDHGNKGDSKGRGKP
jgi:hypothetical protein